MRILRPLSDRFVCNVACLGPLGRSRLAPGTIGSLAGIFWYLLGFQHATLLQFMIAYSLSVIVGTLFCGEAEIRFQEKDPSCIILDEFLAMPLCYWNIGCFKGEIAMWKLILYGFILFRCFDILKPFGIRSLQKMRGGAGIMIDDIAAACATCIVLHITASLIFM